MTEQSSSSYGDTGTGTGTVTDTAAPTNAAAASAIRWAPHGRALTACLVAVNVALVALVYLYFWRLFSRKRSAASANGDDYEEDASSSASTPALASPLRSQDQQREHDRLVASLPTFVVRSGSGAGEKHEECAVCMAELRDGEEARALPRCGHRFHAACVGAWLRRHATCPLCRASVAVAAGTGAGPKGGGVGGGGVTDMRPVAAAAEDMDAPV